MAKKKTMKRRAPRKPRTFASVVRKTYKRRKKSGLSEMFSATTAQAAAKTIGAGALGGFIAGGASKILANQAPLTRYGLAAGASFITYALLGYPNMAAGMAGAFTALESEKIYSGLLNEDMDIYADPDSINQLPVMMNENGDMLTLAQDTNGEIIYLNESTGDVTLAEDVMLAEEIYLNEDASVYPTYDPMY